MNNLSDAISSKHEKEFDALRKSKKKSLAKNAFIAFTALAIVSFVVLALGGYWYDSQNIEKSRRVMTSAGPAWAREMSSQQENLRGWLIGHGTGGEVALFDALSDLLFTSSVSLARSSAATDNMGILTRLYLSVHFGILRIGFIIIVCWRMWILVVAWSVIWGYSSRSVHESTDMLGMTGNGRLFYSGIRAGLHKVSADGAPAVHVTGLACPNFEPPVAVRTSALGKLLENFQVDNATNIHLAGIILKYAEWPSYVAEHEEDHLLAKFYEGESLPASTTMILERAMELHAFYLEHGAEEDPPFLSDIDPASLQEKIDSEQHAKLLQRTFHRVLTPTMRSALCEWTPGELATFVLAHEAGKILTYAHQGGRWRRRSNYGQLNARSILHSCPFYGQEYDYDSRLKIRRAIIYGSRSSVFGPVHMPIDLSEESRAGRQWMELLMACPHALQAIADEVEMIGIVHELHRVWSKRFMEGVMSLDPEVIGGVFATQHNLFFMPITKLLDMVRRCSDAPTLRRLEELVSIVNQRQRLQAMSADLTEGNEKAPLPAYARIFTPFSHQEGKLLAELHGLSPADIKAWSSIRIMLNSYGWLGRRVGEHTVPESSIVFVCFRMAEHSEETNELGLIGRNAMVPIRGTRLEEKWGDFWQSRFIMAQSASMAETKENFDRLMKGLSDPKDEELSNMTSAIA